MFTNIKRDFIFALAISAAILGYGFCGDAQAQTTQPVYIRPSKGAAIALATRETLSPQKTSVVLDMTAFDAAQIRTEAYTAAGAVTSLTSCANVPAIQVYGAPTKTGPFVLENDEFATARIVESRRTYTVNNISAFIRLTLVRDDNTPVGPVPDCVFTVYLTPFPLREILGARGSLAAGTIVETPGLWSVYPVNVGGVGPDWVSGLLTAFGLEVQQTASNNYFGALSVGPRTPALQNTARITVGTNTVVYSGASADPYPHYIRIQNVDTAPIVCKVGALAASTTNYNFGLSAATAADNGTGGSAEFDGMIVRSPSSPGGSNVVCTKTGANPGGVVVTVY